MIISPSLFVCIFVSTEHEQCDIGCLRNTDSFGNQSLIVRRIVELSSVCKPNAALFIYLSPFSIDHFNAIANFVFYSLKHANAASWVIAVTTEMNLCRVWTNHRDRLQRVAIQRQQVVLIFQKRDRSACRFSRQCSMFT